jgi:hypothetical protein
MATPTEYDYSIEDAKDDTGVDDNDIVGDEEETWKYLDNIPEESLGFGWFDKEMATLSGSVDLSSRKFCTAPRPYDRRPSDVPAQHPVRAMAKVLHEAPPNSTVRIYCYALSDPFALDLIIHHGGDKTVKIIMQNCERSVSRIKDLLKRFEKVNSYDVFYSRVELRVANTNKPGCSKYSSMHDKRFMTSAYCLYGSYNLTPVARCTNWEAMLLTDTSQQEINDFDAHWLTLQGREIEQVYPSFYPETFTVPKRRRLS